MSEDWYKVTVRVTLDVEVGVGCIGEDTLGDILSNVEEVVGGWLDKGDFRWQSVDIVDVTVTTIDS